MIARGGIILATVLLGGCSRESAAPTSEENRQLDDVANLLNEAPANLEAIDDSGLAAANESAPAEQY
jgi:hypothetical protein